MASSEGEALNSVGTHLNGAFREAGIVFLVGEVDKKFLADLKVGEVTNRKLLVCANDGEEEGFIAARD